MSDLRRFFRVSALLVVACAVGAMAATPLRISLPPVLEALPIAFAEAWGMFDAEGLSVDVVGITDNQERSTALLTDNLDAVMSDVTSAVLDYCTNHSTTVVAGVGSLPQSGALRVALVSHVGFGPSDVDGLLAGEGLIGVTYRTDEEYLLDQFFAECGQPQAWIDRYTYFSDMLQLAVWFGAKTLPTSVLPEPYYSYIATLLPVSGVPARLAVVTDFSEFPTPPRVLLFRDGFVNKRSDDVATFLRVVDAAVERMNSTSRDEIVTVGLDVVVGLFFQGADRSLIQQQTIDAISIPVFERPAALTSEVFGSITGWMEEKGYLREDVTLEEFARFDLLP